MKVELGVPTNPKLGAENLKFVPMGAFGILKNGSNERRYLVSNGFGPCIGVALYNAAEQSGILAHFMSKNDVGSSFKAVIKKLDVAKLGKDWDAVIFAGSQADASGASGKSTMSGPLDLAVNLSSKHNVNERIGSMESALKDLEATYQTQSGGFETCAIDLDGGILWLWSGNTPGGHNSALALLAEEGAALLYDDKLPKK